MERVSEAQKVLLENDRVRVAEVRQEPGQKMPMHSHPSYVVYSKTPTKMRFTHPDGSSEVVQIQAGQAIYRDAESHVVENIGDTVANVVVVDMKK